MKITQVEPQKNNPHRFNVFIDGLFSFGADEDLVVEYRLIKGKEITSELLEKLLFEAEVGKLMERVYGLLNIRLRSQKEIKDYLKNLSFKRKLQNRDEISESAVNLLIEKLKNKGLINDLEFAKAWVESRRKNKKKGINSLKSELFIKGIDREIVEEVVRCQMSDVREDKIAEQALEKKMRLWKNLPKLEFKKKAYSYLGRKGFEYSIISSVVEKYLKNS